MKNLFLLLVFCPLLILAQQNKIVLQACVKDHNQEAIINAHIIISGHFLKGTATDEQGCFRLEAETFPLQLIISHLNFKTLSLSIKNAEDLPAQIKLEAAEQALPDVMVYAKAMIDTVYQEPYSITDYVFYQEHLILLACKNTFAGFSLILLDEEEKEIQDFSLRKVRPRQLYQSCDGKLYLITGANVVEIVLKENRIAFGESISRDDFSDGLANCVWAGDSLAFFKRYFYQGQALQYTALRRYTEEAAEWKLPLIEDDRNIVLLIEETGNRMPWSGNVWEENISDRLKNLRDSRYSLAGIMKIFYPRLYAPLYPKDSMVCIFNHFAEKLEYFSTGGQPLHSVTIDYQHRKKWTKKVYYDRFREQAYTAFDTPDGVTICPIDMQSGVLGSPTEIPMDFIENIKVWNGHLYYLYRNRGRGEWNRKLHRLYLSL